MSASSNSFMDKLPEPIRRDPKKSAVLAGLAVVLAVLGVRQFTGTAAPAKARAALSGTNLATERSTPDISAKSREAGNPQQDAGERVAQWLGMPIKALDRNLFESKLENFQRLDSVLADHAAVVADELFWEQLAKSLTSQADQKKQKLIRSENLQLAASSLRLQTTLMGSSPKALIDGRMVRAGDMVEATLAGVSVNFHVLRIEARSVVIENDGVQIELKMGAGKARIVQE